MTSDLFWPGDERAGALLSAPALLHAMVSVESAWLAVLVDANIAPAAARTRLEALVGDADVTRVAADAESGGNPVIGLTRLLRERAPEPAANWLHRGLTSQDVLDSALMLCLRDARERVLAELAGQVRAAVGLIGAHRRTIMCGRTLTQHAVPITFAGKAAGWLRGILDAAEDLARIALPAQFGGAAGTLAATAELARRAGAAVPALELAGRAAAALQLAPALPWHTARSPVTRLGDALAACTDACAKVAEDVLLLARPEIGELAEPAGRGGSSSMPHKANPILSVLIRRAALTTPMLAATLHVAAAQARDERPDGAWHAEWATLQALTRRTVVACAQTAELLAGLRVATTVMRRHVEQSAGALGSEHHAVADVFAASGPAPSGRAADDRDRDAPDEFVAADYLGATDEIIDAVLARAHRYLQEAR
jgi:3-carboxy-cis,cis-muconate cycloisomerase